MLGLLLLLAESRAFFVEPSTYHQEVADSVMAIAEQYLSSRCLAYLFQLNFTRPSVLDVPLLVRSDLLERVHKEWAPNLPAANPYETYAEYFNPPLGALNYLRCSHIIILDDEKPLVPQIDYIIYTFYSNFYKDGGGTKTRMVVVTTSEVNETEVYRLLYHMYTMGDIDVDFVGRKRNTTTVFSFFPFGVNGKICPDNSTKLETLDTWENNTFVRKANLFPEKVPHVFNDCIINVTTIDAPPFFFIDSKNRSYYGIEHQVLQMFAMHLGLRVRYFMYMRHDGWLYSEGKDLFGSMVDLRRGKAWISLGLTANSVYNFPCIFVPQSYVTTTVCWFFRNPQEIPTWKLIYMAFSELLWLVVFATMVLFPYSLYLLGKLERSTEFLKNFSECILVSWSIAVGHSSSVRLKTNAIHFVFATWLFYTIHINLAYTASLAGLMTTGKIEPKITTFEQMVKRDLKTALDVYLSTLHPYIDDPLIKKVMTNFVKFDENSFYNMEKFGNVSVLGNNVIFSYLVATKKSNIYRSNMNLNFFGIGFMLRRNHFIVGRLAAMSSRVFESGIAVKIVKEFTALSGGTFQTVKLRAYSLKDLAGPFSLLIFGYLLSILVFLVELVIEVFLKHVMNIYYKCF